MIYSIKKIARIFSLFSFVLIFFCGIDHTDLFSLQVLAIAFTKALCGSIALWFIGLVVSDILLKGIVEDIPEHSIEQMEGGILQRIYERKKENGIKQLSSKVNEKQEEKKPNRK